MKNKKQTEIYFRILDIGKSEMLNGVFLEDIIVQLRNESYNITPSLEASIRTFFWNNFVQINPPEETSKFYPTEQLKNFKYTLSSDALFYLEQLEENRINRRNSSWAIWIAGIGVVLTGLAGIPSWISYFEPKNNEILKNKYFLIVQSHKKPLPNTKMLSATKPSYPKNHSIQKDTSKVNNKSNRKPSASH